MYCMYVVYVCLILEYYIFVIQFPITALREIKILKLLRHENIVNLVEICRTKGELA